MVTFSTVFLRLLLWSSSYATVSAQLTVTTLPNVLFQSNDGVHNIVEESVVWLYCTANSTIATPSVTWTKNGVALVNDPPHIRIRSSSDGTDMSTTSSLVIDNLNTSDGGSYMCKASDGMVTMNSSALSLTGFSFSANGTLLVLTTPVSNEETFERNSIYPLDNRTAVPLGSTVDSVGTADSDKLLRCVAGHVGDTGPGSFSPPSVVWVRNGEQVVADSRITINENTIFGGQRMQSDLQISNFSFSDVGVYQCIFTDVDSDAEVITTTPLRLDTGDELSLERISPEFIVLDPPEKLVVEIWASGGYRQIQWTRNGQPFSPSSSDPFFVRPDEFSNFFEIFVRSPTTVDDRYGAYTVDLLVTGSGQIQATPLNFFVTSYDPPETMPYNQNVTVTVLEGDSVNISCGSVGQPIPTILWELNGSPAPFPQSDSVTDYQAVLTNGGFIFTYGNITSVLTITNIVFPDHEGEYTCKGRNSHRGVESSAYSNITVHVLVIPEVQLTATPPVVLIGGFITLTCNVTRANPTNYSTFTWTHDNSSTALPETGNTLTLSSVRESDLGVYRCEVTNSAGTGSGTFNLAIATCTGDCTVQVPAGVPVTTIIAAVCSVAMAILLLLVAAITILMIWKFKKNNYRKKHTDIDMQDNPVYNYGLQLPDLSLSGAHKLADQQTSNVNEHVYAHASTVTKQLGTAEKHSSTSEKKYDYVIVTTSSSVAENRGYTTVGEQTTVTERVVVYDEASGVTQSVGKSLEDNGRQISATNHDHVTHGYVNVSRQTSATGKNMHDETVVKTPTIDDHVYDQPVTS